MQIVQVGRCTAFVVALGLPMLGITAMAAEDVPTGARSDAQVVEIAHFRHQTGKTPLGGVILASDGNYYGTTLAGGNYGWGSIYRVSPTGTVKSLHDFKSEGDGRQPPGALVQGSDGALYGVAGGGSSERKNRNGVIFRVTLDGDFKVIHRLDEHGVEGAGLNAPLIQGRDGNLYGTTLAGGMGDRGVVFRVSLDGSYAVLAQFEPGQLFQPWGPPLEGDDGDLYLAAHLGGSGGVGGIARISRATGSVTSLYEFSGDFLVDGGYPRNHLVYDAAHESFWGVGQHCVFRYDIQASASKTVGCFAKGQPSQVTLGPDGVHFYVLDKTTAYSVAPDGTVQAIGHLPGPASRNEQMILDATGALVGTTTTGGDKHVGTVFKIEGY